MEDLDKQISEAGRLRIARLRMKPGDVLVARVENPITQEVAQRLRHQLLMLVPDGVKVLVTDQRVEFSVASASA